jgi:hypothetical protein
MAETDESKRQTPSNEHLAAASYRALRGRMVELWAAMPRMVFLIDLNRAAQEQEAKK